MLGKIKLTITRHTKKHDSKGLFKVTGPKVEQRKDWENHQIIETHTCIQKKSEINEQFNNVEKTENVFQTQYY